MLVLTRKVDERIHIGDDVTITIVRIGPGCVRIGVEAPPHMDILRGELTQGSSSVALAGSDSDVAV
jgi:carbon storage regulator